MGIEILASKLPADVIGTYRPRPRRRRFLHSYFLCQHFWARSLMLATNLSNWPSVIEWFSYRTTTPRLLTFGDEPRHVDIRGWRYGPRRLRVNDDELPEVNTAKLPTPKLSVMAKFERLSGLWNYRLSRPTGTFLTFYFQNPKTWFLRFFELPHTFSRTLVVSNITTRRGVRYVTQLRKAALDWNSLPS